MRLLAFQLFWLSTIFLLFSGLLRSNAAAQGIRFHTQHTYLSSDTKTKIKATGQGIHSEFYGFNQRYNLDLSKTIFPYLTFQTGSLFEWNNTTSKTEGTKFDTEERLLQPFVGLSLTNPLWLGGINYRRTEIREDLTDLPTTENIRDEVNGNLVWQPAELPVFKMYYTLNHSYNHPKTLDQVEKLFVSDTTYTAWGKLYFEHIYTRQDREDRLANLDTLEQTQFGKIEYTDNFFRDRLFLNTTYRIRYNSIEFPANATVQSPLQRFQGLSSLDDTPGEGALEVNAALIDGNLFASAGINIGTAGDQTQAANIGVDLGVDVDVDQITIWVDRRLSASVANSFSWEVYTSPDNTDTSTWTLVATVSPAPFGVFENRFDISFSSVKTRFIKVVTDALSPTIPGSADFTNIFVTELEAFTTRSGLLGSNKSETVDHNYDLNLVARLTDKTRLGYNFEYLFLDREAPAEDRSQMTNNIYVNHAFNEIFSSHVRLQRTDTKEGDEDMIDYTYGASIRGAYLPTFNQTLAFSGENTKEDQGSTYNYSVFLRNNAILYRGWSAFADLGYSWNLDLNDMRNSGTNVRLGTNLIPNDVINCNVTYRFSKTKTRNDQTTESSTSELDFELFLTPAAAVSGRRKSRC